MEEKEEKDEFNEEEWAEKWDVDNPPPPEPAPIEDYVDNDIEKEIAQEEA